MRKLLNLKFIFPQLILLFSLFQILSDSVELQLTYFCGGWRECGNISSPSSLQLAKYSVETGYSVVGVVERFNTSVNLLEAVLPEWFRGAAGLVTEDKRNRNSLFFMDMTSPDKKFDVCVFVPREYSSLDQYSATLGHKANHDREANAR